MRIRPDSKYPKKRLIVFAGLAANKPRMDAMKIRKVEAVMASFERVREGKWWDKVREHLDTWPQYRYLDSGVFTLMRMAAASRINTQSQPKAQAVAGMSLERILMREKGAVPEAQVRELFSQYLEYLDKHLDEWDFVMNLDVDALKIERSDGTLIPGVVVADRATERLKKVAGDKLIPVWHGTVDEKFDRWRGFVKEFGYVAIGSDISPRFRQLRYLCDMAHQEGVLVHGLGSTRADILNVMPFDTVDSTTWLSGVRFGQYGGFMYPKRKDTLGRRTTRKALSFEKLTRQMGYDPEALVAEGGPKRVHYEVALAFLQLRQEEARPIPPPLTSPLLPLG